MWRGEWWGLREVLNGDKFSAMRAGSLYGPVNPFLKEHEWDVINILLDVRQDRRKIIKIA